jgi:hypothetical protein
MSQERKPFVGAKVFVSQHGSPEKVLALITHVHPPGHKYFGTVNLAVFNVNGTQGNLIGSPEDSTGTRGGCWFFSDDRENYRPTGY